MSGRGKGGKVKKKKKKERSKGDPNMILENPIAENCSGSDFDENTSSEEDIRSEESEQRFYEECQEFSRNLNERVSKMESNYSNLEATLHQILQQLGQLSNEIRKPPLQGPSQEILQQSARTTILMNPEKGNKRLPEEDSDQETTNEFQLNKKKQRRQDMTDLDDVIEMDEETAVAVKHKTRNQHEEGYRKALSGAQKALLRACRPPPIVIANKMIKIPEINRELKAKEIKFQVKSGKGGVTKFLLPTEDDYRRTARYFEERRDIEFHQYQMGNEKPLKYVVRPVPVNWDEEDSKECIEDCGFNPTKVIRLKKGKNIPMPLILVILPNVEENKNFANLKSIGNLIIEKIEPFRGSRRILQCYKCQLLHHVAAGCHHKPRCARCAGEHNTKECVHDRVNFKPKCALCQGKHSSSYGGCPVKSKARQARMDSARIIPRKSYAKAATNSPPPEKRTSKTEETKAQRNTTPKQDRITKMESDIKSLTQAVNQLVQALQPQNIRKKTTEHE